MEDCQKRINNMVEEAKCKAQLPLEEPLSALVSVATALLCFMCTVQP
jgi:hypothetical protein